MTAPLTLSSDDTPSGFLKLSAEIRNKIYHLTLVTGFVVIQDLHPEEWQAEQEAGHATRTSFKTKDHSAEWCFWRLHNEMPCTLKTEQWKNAKISYTLLKRCYLTLPTIGMLALNLQTRAEAVPIFYGRNEFCFRSMSAVLPFLEDRSDMSLQSMHHFHLEMEVDRAKYQKRRSEGWAQTFAGLRKMKLLSVHKLTVNINDPGYRYAWKLKLDTKLQGWVHEMAKSITNLDMLGVVLDFDISLHGRTEELLWEFLAPKMLKNVGDGPHNAHSLLERRIRYDEYLEEFNDSELES